MIAAMPPRAILLDALGTLVALEPPVPAFTALMRERHGIDLDAAAVGRAFGVEMRHYRERCVGAADATALASLRRECAAIVAGELELELPAGELEPTLLDSLRFSPYPEVPGALARWRAAGRRLVVASNWDVSLHDVLAATGLAQALDGVVTSAEVGAAKPAAAPFEAALALAGATAAEAVHVGDGLVEDVEGARAAGIEAFWLRRAPSDEPAPDGVAVIASLDELPVAP